MKTYLVGFCLVCIPLSAAGTASAQSRLRSAGLLEADKRQPNPSPQPGPAQNPVPVERRTNPSPSGIKATGSVSVMNNLDLPGVAVKFGTGGSKAAGQPASGCVTAAIGPSFGGVMSLTVGGTQCSNGQRAVCGELGVSGGFGLAGSYGKGVCWDPDTGSITPFVNAGVGYGAKLPGIGGYSKQVEGSVGVEIPHDAWSGAFGKRKQVKPPPRAPEQLGHDRVRSLLVPPGPTAASPKVPYDPRFNDRPTGPLASFRDSPTTVSPVPPPKQQPKPKTEVFGPSPPPRMYAEPIGPQPAPAPVVKPIAKR